jgi:hypothetical protein
MNTQEIQRPQPVTYGLTFGDIIDAGMPFEEQIGLEFAPKRVNQSRVAICLLCCVAAISSVISFIIWIYSHRHIAAPWGLLVGAPGLALMLWNGICAPILNTIHKRKIKPAIAAYCMVLRSHYEEQKHVIAAQAAAREAAHQADMRKRSYWTALDGWAFEHACAEVLGKHQFSAVVTRGSGDGGIDIEVTRNGLKGVVQCKAHTSCAGPSVVRDLYGVIHHFGVSFGIVVSRGGFTRGAIEFARDKPILFLDVSDLIAMQEGRDVLAGSFSKGEAL